MPRCLFLIANSRCDIACKYCFYTTDYEQRDLAVFDTSRIDSLCERLAALDFDIVKLTGGDPLNTKYKEVGLGLIARLTDRSFKVVVNTSGARLTSNDCAALARIAPFRIDFSIDSHRQDIHDEQRGEWQSSVNAVKTLLALGYSSIRVTTVVTPINCDHLAETKSYFAALGVRECKFQPAFLPENARGYAHWTPSLGEAWRSIHRNETAEEEDGWLIQYAKWCEDWFNKSQSRLEPRCLMGKRIFVSDARGRLAPCFHRADIALGNLLDDPIDELAGRLARFASSFPELPSCVGGHCVSLFQERENWPLRWKAM